MYKFKINEINSEFNPANNYFIADSQQIMLNTTIQIPCPKTYLKITSACNINCVYCFQQNDLTRDYSINIDEYYSLIESEINSINKQIIIFGGEPFLTKNINILQRIFDLCYSNKLVFYTNGYFDSQIRNLLIKNRDKIDNLQISVDGPELIHNLRRQYHRDNGYKVIIENCKELVLRNIPFHIQVNIDCENIYYVDSLLYDLILHLDREKYTIVLNRVLGTSGIISEEDLLMLHIKLIKEFGDGWIYVNSNTLKRITSFFTNQGYIDNRCDISETKVFDFQDNTIYACPQIKDSKMGTFSHSETILDYSKIKILTDINYKKNAGCLNCIFYHFCNKGCLRDNIDFISCKAEMHKIFLVIFNNFDIFFKSE